ncbi:MAG: triose-phosphate isomerase [Rhodospirillales bacterium]|nr:triose-phosphate isomerase [Rhodospirillales bacterium]
MRLVAGNWKMNGSPAAVTDLVAGLTQRLRAAEVGCTAAVCPPAHLLAAAVAAAGAGLAVGSQDCSDEAGPGAFTGEISAFMLAETGCRYAIVGHSERRQRHGESNTLVRAKASRALAAGLVPIVCVGETLKQREAGDAAAVVSEQVQESLPEGWSTDTLVIAYEPVWAIGTGLTATAADIAEMHSAIGAVMGSRRAAILYGGSVKPGNAAEILGTEGVNGALIGGASLKLDDFWGIVTAA